jgi:hypothetical protein
MRASLALWLLLSAAAIGFYCFGCAQSPGPEPVIDFSAAKVAADKDGVVKAKASDGTVIEMRPVDAP